MSDEKLNDADTVIACCAVAGCTHTAFFTRYARGEPVTYARRLAVEVFQQDGRNLDDIAEACGWRSPASPMHIRDACKIERRGSAAYMEKITGDAARAIDLSRRVTKNGGVLR